MQIETVGILINMYPFSERDMVARVFTKDAGVLAGMLRGAVVSKNKPLVGQYGALSWNARLDSQLGVFHWEAEKNLSAPLMIKSDLLKLMNSAFALIYTLIPERESYEHLYMDTVQLLKDLAISPSPYETYLKWEIDFACIEAGLPPRYHTGEEIEQAPELFDVIRELDVLVDGPFVEAERDISLRFRGSCNQRLIDVQRTISTGTLTLWQPAN